MHKRNIMIRVACIVLMLIVVSCAQEPPMTITPVNHTDQNWVNGVAKSWGAAFFVPNPSDAKKVIAVGKRVTFSNGTTRTITSIKENSGALIVNLDGAPLDGNVVGYPNKIAVH